MTNHRAQGSREWILTGRRVGTAPGRVTARVRATVGVATFAVVVGVAAGLPEEIAVGSFVVDALVDLRVLGSIEPLESAKGWAWLVVYLKVEAIVLVGKAAILETPA